MYDLSQALRYLDLVQNGRFRTPVLAELDEVGSCPVVVNQQHLWGGGSNHTNDCFSETEKPTEVSPSR